MSLSKERRDAIRRELDDPSVDFEPYDSTVRALLDLADERDKYRALLRDAREAIASLPEGALGYSGDDNAWWPIRDELLHNIDAALEGKHEWIPDEVPA